MNFLQWTISVNVKVSSHWYDLKISFILRNLGYLPSNRSAIWLSRILASHFSFSSPFTKTTPSPTSYLIKFHNSSESRQSFWQLFHSKQCKLLNDQLTLIFFIFFLLIKQFELMWHLDHFVWVCFRRHIENCYFLHIKLLLP